VDLRQFPLSAIQIHGGDTSLPCQNYQLVEVVPQPLDLYDETVQPIEINDLLPGSRRYDVVGDGHSSLRRLFPNDRVGFLCDPEIQSFRFYNLYLLVLKLGLKGGVGVSPQMRLAGGRL